MQANFPEALQAVLKSEGGYSDNKFDPGGKTNFGITQHVYDALNDARGHARQSVEFIHQDEVAAIYKQQYWDAVHGDVLPSGLDYVVFDYAVNSGPHKALAAYAATPTIDGICDSRLGFLKGLSTWVHFGHGWGARVASVRALGKIMASSQPAAQPAPSPAPVAPIPPKPQTPPQRVPSLPAFSFWGWLISFFHHQPAPQGLLGDTTMSVIPVIPAVKKSSLLSNINILSLLSAFGGLTALLPKIVTEFSTAGLIAAAAMVVGILIQALIPAGTAVAIENTLADTVLPAVAVFDPALKASLNDVAAGLHASIAASTANTAATANNTAAVAAAAPAAPVA